MHTLKTKLQKYQVMGRKERRSGYLTFALLQSFIDKAFQLIHQGADEHIFEGCTIVTK